jgi:hypothetical protein
VPRAARDFISLTSGPLNICPAAQGLVAKLRPA